MVESALFPMLLPFRPVQPPDDSIFGRLEPVSLMNLPTMQNVFSKWTFKGTLTPRLFFRQFTDLHFISFNRAFFCRRTFYRKLMRSPERVFPRTRT